MRSLQSVGAGRPPAGAQCSICEYTGGGETTLGQHTATSHWIDTHNGQTCHKATLASHAGPHYIGLTSGASLDPTTPHWVHSEVALDSLPVEAPRKHAGPSHIGPVTLDHLTHSTGGHTAPPGGHIGPVTEPYCATHYHIGLEVGPHWARYPESTQREEREEEERKKRGGGEEGRDVSLLRFSSFTIRY